jgi:predicted PurR-regulated permease PerM
MNSSNRPRPYSSIDRAQIETARRERLALVPSSTVARVLIVLVLLAGVYFFHGFIVPVLAALVIGFASWPLYRRLLAAIGGSRTLGASIALVLVLSFIVIPITLASVYAMKEVRVWAAWAVHANTDGAAVPLWLTGLPFAGDMLSEQWTRYLSHPGGLGELVQAVSGSNIGNIYRGVITFGATAFQALLTLLFMLITLFFVYRNGEGLVAQLDRVGERILPERWERVSRIVPLTISSTVTGMTIIAIGEGIVLGIAYWIAGVPSPVTLGVITGIMALIPGGAPLSSGRS